MRRLTQKNACFTRVAGIAECILFVDTRRQRRKQGRNHLPSAQVCVVCVQERSHLHEKE